MKGAVDAYDPPLEARVPRLDRCCLKQKVGYSRDAAPKNDSYDYGRNRSRARGTSRKLYEFLFLILFLSEPRFKLVSLRQARYRLVRCFRCPCFPLGISVEYHVLEIMGLNPESGLTMGDFAFQIVSLNHSCVVRTLTHTPFFPRRFHVWYVFWASQAGQSVILA